MKKECTGSVLIIVMWLIMLGLILVTTISSNIRLSALTVINHQAGLQQQAKLLETLDKVYFELLINKMPKLAVNKTTLYKEKIDSNLYSGQLVKLSYQKVDDISVRIYDLSGKININRLTEARLTQLLEGILGASDKRIPALVDAWFDWIDNNELKRLNGAEQAYYKKNKLPYIPRNGAFESVDEVLLVKGFSEVFKNIKLNEVFTINSLNNGTVNPNVASRDTLLMLPGMDEKSVDSLLEARKYQTFKNKEEVFVHLTPAVISRVQNWFSFNKSNFFMLAIYPSEYEQADKDTQTIIAYVEYVRLLNDQSLPIVLRVVPDMEITIDK